MSLKKRVEKVENLIERKEDDSLRWPIFEDILAILNALDRGNEEFLKKFHPLIIQEFRKIHEKNRSNKINS